MKSTTLLKGDLGPYHSVLRFIIAVGPLLFSSFSGFAKHTMLYSFVDPLVFWVFFSSLGQKASV